MLCAALPAPRDRRALIEISLHLVSPYARYAELTSSGRPYAAAAHTPVGMLRRLLMGADGAEGGVEGDGGDTEGGGGDTEGEGDDATGDGGGGGTYGWALRLMLAELGRGSSGQAGARSGPQPPPAPAPAPPPPADPSASFSFSFGDPPPPAAPASEAATSSCAGQAPLPPPPPPPTPARQRALLLGLSLACAARSPRQRRTLSAHLPQILSAMVSAATFAAEAAEAAEAGGGGGGDHGGGDHGGGDHGGGDHGGGGGSGEAEHEAGAADSLRTMALQALTALATNDQVKLAPNDGAPILLAAAAVGSRLDLRRRPADPTFAVPSACAFGASHCLLSAMLRQRPRLVHACVPLLIACVRSHLLALVHAPARAAASPPPAAPAAFGVQSGRAVAAGAPAPSPGVECARHLRRLLEGLALHKKVLVRHGSYLLAEVVGAMRERPLHPSCQRELLPGVHALLGMCTEVEVQAVYAASSGDGGRQRVLKDLVESYERSFKYKGKA